MVGFPWEQQLAERVDYDGVAWYRLDFDIPLSMNNIESFVLNLGPIDDESQIFLNGTLIHELTEKTHPETCWREPRILRIDKSMLRTGGHQTLIIRCTDFRGNGGMTGHPMMSVPRPQGFYVDTPIAEDDPYRFYHW